MVNEKIDAFIIQAGDLLDRVIINNEITISEMPSVQLLDPLLEHDEVFEQLKKIIKEIYIQSSNL